MAETATSQETTEEGTELTAEEQAVATAEAAKAAEASAEDTSKASEKKDEEKDERVVPETYELKLPEDSLLDPSKLEDISSFAKENKLTAEEAQALVDRESKQAGEGKDANEKLLVDLRSDWEKESKADKTIGGDNYTKTVELSARVQDTFGSEAFGQMLKDTGFDKHPEWLRFASKIGSVMADDQFVRAGAKGGSEEKSFASTFYKNTKQA